MPGKLIIGAFQLGPKHSHSKKIKFPGHSIFETWELYSVIVPSTLPTKLQDTAKIASDILTRLTDTVAKAHDNLLLKKITQIHHTSSAHAADPRYKKGDFVMLSTTNRQHEYKKTGEKRMAKFFPRWDGLYCITDCHTEASTYTLDIPTDAYPTFHASLLKHHITNDASLFPSHKFKQPGPILTTNVLEEYLVDTIMNSIHSILQQRST